jgi:hypothetical protein
MLLRERERNRVPGDVAALDEQPSERLVRLFLLLQDVREVGSVDEAGLDQDSGGLGTSDSAGLGWSVIESSRKGPQGEGSPVLSAHTVSSLSP